LLVIENSEPALYAVTEALLARETRAVIGGRIADIRDPERILRLMMSSSGHRVSCRGPQTCADSGT